MDFISQYQDAKMAVKAQFKRKAELEELYRMTLTEIATDMILGDEVAARILTDEARRLEHQIYVACDLIDDGRRECALLKQKAEFQNKAEKEYADREYQRSV